METNEPAKPVVSEGSLNDIIKEVNTPTEVPGEGTPGAVEPAPGAGTAEPDKKDPPAKPAETKPVEKKEGETDKPGEAKPEDKDTPIAFTATKKKDAPAGGVAPADKEKPTTTAQPSVNDWKAAIKAAKREDILKELGLDEFDIQFVDFRKGGGDPLKYLDAKGRDWTKVPDLDLIKDQIKAENGYLSADELNILTQAELEKYGLDPDASEALKRVGPVILKRDAQKIREARIAEQAKFQIPANQANNNGAPTAEQLQQQRDEYNNKIIQHPSRQTLLQTKRVVAALGDGSVKLNFDVDPQEVINFWLDSKTAAAHMLTETGEPDYGKQDIMALWGMNPDLVMNSFINYGKTLAKQELVDGNRNIDKKSEVIPGKTAVTEKEAWRNAKEVPMGSL